METPARPEETRSGAGLSRFKQENGSAFSFAKLCVRRWYSLFVFFFGGGGGLKGLEFRRV